ncbi:MAG: universal stress protein [Chloroflexi bacterium]|nr:MAG: universal stress protein [Chloroflexota bacterium]
MLNIDKILFPTDFSDCAESAFSHAAYLADRYDAELHILHVEEEKGITLADRLDDFCITPDEIAEQLHLPTAGKASAGSDEPVPIIEVEERAERAAPAILHYAETHGIDLIVMGTHGRRGIRRFMLGSVTEEVLRLAPCPVFTVRHREDRSVWAMKKILAPTDLSKNARQATRHAAALAEAYGAELKLLHIIDAATLTTSSVSVIGAFDASPANVMTGANEAVLRQAAELTEEFHLPSQIDCFVTVGNPASDILDFAQENEADLIVVGSHGRSGLPRFVMGSVAEKVIRDAPCPVFTVKSFGRSLLHAMPEMAETEAVPS